MFESNYFLTDKRHQFRLVKCYKRQPNIFLYIYILSIQYSLSTTQWLLTSGLLEKKFNSPGQSCRGAGILRLLSGS